MRINRSADGFTLIELLVTIAVLGILTAISIRQLAVHKARAFDARAEHDLRLAIAAEEAYYGDNEMYVGCADAGCESSLGHFSLSSGTHITLTATDEGNGFSAEAYHSKGGTRFRFDSGTNKIRAG